MTSRWNKIVFLCLALLALSLVAVGCGNSNKSTIPVTPDEPDNPFALASIGTDSTLEVMTWNLEHFAKNGSSTAELVIQAVSSLDVDIVALQEIESSFRFQEVVAGLDGWSGFRATSSGYNMNLAYLFRDNGRLQVDSIQEIMPEESRIFLRRPLLLLGSFDGKPIAVINSHLKCCSEGVEKRRSSCLLLEDYTLANLSDRRVYLVGDFNDELTDPQEENVFANFLGDPNQWLVADLGIAQGSSSGWSYPGWPSHIDHIIINHPLFDAAQGNTAQILVVPLFSFLPQGWSEYDDNISDHLPLVLKLQP